MLRRAVFSILMASAPLLSSAAAQPNGAEHLSGNSEIARTLRQGEAHAYSVALERGGSVDIVVTQQGVDLVVEVFAPDGAQVTSVDSPNGRNGDEPVEVFAAAAGDYRILVRPFSNDEPEGQYLIRVRALRDRAATAVLLQERRAERRRATEWLRGRASRFTMRGLDELASEPAFRVLTDQASVIGLGEATHGSREFGDARLGITQVLVSRFGYRVIALEGSAARIRALRPWLEGGAPVALPPEPNAWIGVRTRASLFEWVRGWNIAHPQDMIALVGLDASDNVNARSILARFIESAYGEDASAAWAPVNQELADADIQTFVFGNSSISEETRAAALAQLARLNADAALLRPRLGAAVDEAIAAANDLAQFADFNAGETPASHNRDWYMATNVAAALSAHGAGARAVLWAHNAHVVGGRLDARTTGAALRAAFGCGYRSVALTFGEGGFLAQIPNDPADRLNVSVLPRPADESIEAVVHAIGPGDWFASWTCGSYPQSVPDWLSRDQRLRWVGALWAPGTPSDLGVRPFNLTRDFDAVLYVNRVSAERMPVGRVTIAPRNPSEN